MSGSDGKKNKQGKRRRSQPIAVPSTPGEPPEAVPGEVSEVSAATGIPASESGSVEVSLPGVSLPGVALPDVPAQSSGSVDVSLTGLAGAASTSGSVEVAPTSSSDPGLASTSLAAVSDGTPAEVGDQGSVPVASTKVGVAHASGEGPKRSKRITEAAKEKIGASVEKFGEGLGIVGEGVSKLGDISRKVPLVGELTSSGVTKLGEGLTQVGESIHAMPRVAATRRGRLLVRSLFVGFVLIAAWISIIVALQLRSNETPDFRPIAEKVLVDLSKGTASIEELYDRSSPRFQEMVRREQFVDNMNDMLATVGPFREITAVNDTLVTTGPTGRVGRVSLTVAYEKVICKASVSLHYDKGAWKLLGIGVELPPELQITQAQREERVQACKDPESSDCDLNVAANQILEQLRDGKAAEVYDNATRVFQNQEEKTRWVDIQLEHAAILGRFSRILDVTEAKVYGGTNATFDAILEFERANGVRAIFGFYRRSKQTPWKLRSYKIVLPMPRAGEREATASPAKTPKPGVLVNDDDDDEPTNSDGGPAQGAGAGRGSGSAAPPRAGSGTTPRTPTPRPTPRPSTGAGSGSAAKPPATGSAAGGAAVPAP